MCSHASGGRLLKAIFFRGEERKLCVEGAGGHSVLGIRLNVAFETISMIVVSLSCPIRHTVMNDPVLMPDGQTYERAAIAEWLRQTGVSPVTRQAMEIGDASPNRTVGSMLKQLLREEVIPGPLFSSNWFCQIKVPGHDLYLDYSSRGAEGEFVVLGRRRTWQCIPIKPGVFAILSDTGIALDIAGGAQEGRDIMLWPRHDGDNQQWTVRSDQLIQSPGTGLALDVRGAVFTVGQHICAWPPHAGVNQKWEIQVA
jgi:hypothetical protein